MPEKKKWEEGDDPEDEEEKLDEDGEVSEDEGEDF